MPVLKTEFQCPECVKATGQSVQIVASAGELSCPNGHKWNDTMSFMNLSPKMVFKVIMPILPQQNHVPLTITVPAQLKEHLNATYGEKLGPTVVGVLSQLSNNSLVISDGDLERLQERLGKRPVNSGELVGLVYSKVCEADDAKAERDLAVADLKAYEGLAPGRVVIDLGDQFVTAQMKAKDAEMPLKYWCEKVFVGALRDAWF